MPALSPDCTDLGVWSGPGAEVQYGLRGLETMVSSMESSGEVGLWLHQ